MPLGSHYAWWDWQPGADWRRPDGPASTLNGRERHPVVHVAWEDVIAYAAWAAKAIPSKPSGICLSRRARRLAVRLGAGAAPKGRMLANYWQGEFPWQNLALDGYERTARSAVFLPMTMGCLT